MRKVIMINRISIDGYYATKNQATQGMDWFIHDPKVDAATHKPVKSDTLILGHTTYRLFEQVWSPLLDDTRADPKMKAVAAELTQMRKLVFSSTEQKTSWANTEFYSDDPGLVVGNLRRSVGPDLLILGSGSIVEALSRLSFIDEYIFIVSPVIAGDGKALFPHIDQQKLELLSSESFDSGNVVIHYKVKDEGTQQILANR